MFRTVLFLFLAWACVPSFGDIIYYFIINEIGFSKSFIAALTLVGFIGLFFGSSFYNWFFKNIDYPKMMFIGQILLQFTVILNLLFIMWITKEYFHINDIIFCLFTDIGGEILFQALMVMPTLVMQAWIIPKNVEGTVFAMF